MKAMRMTMMMLAMLIVTAGTATAQNSRPTEKATKEARKEAKRLVKEGWKAVPGGLPLERQMDRSYNMQYDGDEWVSGNGQSTSEVYDAAKMQATELARLELATKIGSECTGLIENLTANKQLAGDDAAAISTLMSESKTIFSQRLGKVKTVVEAYRELPNRNKQVMVRLFARQSDIERIAKSAIRDELEKRGVKMTDELNAMLSAGKN